MQKKLIALAIAGLSSAAFAQSNVTIYGVLDGAQESVKATGATTAAQDQLSRGRFSSNSSYVGFKGSEALGNGLTAVFQVENQVNFDNYAASATNAWASRDSFVGLTGGFGTVVGGTLTHPMRVLGAKVDNNPGASSIGFTGSIYGELNGIKTGTDDRATNAVAYITPTVSGFHGVLAYVNGETARTNATNNVNSKAWQIAGVYDNGPLFVGVAHHDAKDPAVLGAAVDSKFKADRLAAAYTFGGTRLSGLMDKQKATFNAGGTDVKRTAYMLGASQTFGANQVYLQFAKAKDLTGSAVAGLTDTGSKQVTLGYAYNLSKRTVAHAYYSKITNKSNGQYDFYVGAVGGTNASNLGLGGATNIGAGADPTGYGVGLRHSF